MVTRPAPTGVIKPAPSTGPAIAVDPARLPAGVQPALTDKTLQRKLDLLSAADIIIPSPAAIRETTRVDILTPSNAALGTHLDMFNVQRYSTKDGMVQLAANPNPDSDQSWVVVSWGTAPDLSYILDCEVSGRDGVKFTRFEQDGDNRRRLDTVVSATDTGYYGYRAAIVLPATSGFSGYSLYILGQGGQPWSFMGCDITPVG